MNSKWSKTFASLFVTQTKDNFPRSGPGMYCILVKIRHILCGKYYMNKHIRCIWSRLDYCRILDLRWKQWKYIIRQLDFVILELLMLNTVKVLAHLIMLHSCLVYVQIFLVKRTFSTCMFCIDHLFWSKHFTTSWLIQKICFFSCSGRILQMYRHITQSVMLLTNMRYQRTG